MCLFDSNSNFARLSDLSANWTNDYSGNGGMSAAPIYLGLMAISGVYLIKNSLRYIFTSENSNKIGKDKKENG